MDVRLLTIARYAEVNPDGTSTLVGAGLDVLRVSAVPAVIPILYVVTKIALTREESATPHTIQIRILTPRGENLFTTDPINLAEQEIPLNRNLFVSNLRLSFANLTFSEEGLHTFQLVFDGNPVKEWNLRIAVEATQPSTDEQFIGGARTGA